MSQNQTSIQRLRLLKLASTFDKTAARGTDVAERSVGRWLAHHGDNIAEKALPAAAIGLGAYLWNKRTAPTLASKVKGNLANAIGFGLGGAALAGGAYAGTQALRGATEPFIKQRAFNDMLKENPSLKNEDKDVVRKSFNTLHTFNPTMAKDPLVAGAFVRRAAMFKDEGIQASDVKTLAEVRKNLSDSRKSDNDSRFLNLAKTLHGIGDE